MHKYIISALVALFGCMTINATGLKSLQGAHVGYAVINLNTGEMTHAHNSRELFVPASTLKCVTAAVALDRLGCDYSFPTEICTTGHITADTLIGNLIINPAGDPSLDYSLCTSIKDLGISHITGHLSVSASEPEINPTVMMEDIGTEYGVGWSTFNYEGNRALVNDSMWVFPLQYIIDDLTADLTILGITISNIAASDTVISMRILHRSKPLSQLCRHMLHESDNLYAQSIGRAISPDLNLNSAIDSVNTWIKSSGLPDKSLRMVDMSGLARTNYVTPELLAQLLKQMAANQHYVGCFPRVGREGTVKRGLLYTTHAAHE